MKKLSLFLILAFSCIVAKNHTNNHQSDSILKNLSLYEMLQMGVVVKSYCAAVTPFFSIESGWVKIGSFKNPNAKPGVAGGGKEFCDVYAKELKSKKHKKSKTHIQKGLTGGDSHKVEPVVFADKNNGVFRSTTQASGNLVADTGQVAAGAVEGTAEVAGGAVKGVGQALGNIF